MKSPTFLNIGLLILVALVLYYPLLYTTYFYTDEITQLWRYGKDPAFHMFVPQGRFFTDRLFTFLYGSIDTIGELKGLRVFSLLGWIGCLPIWYGILSRICRREGLPFFLPLLTTLFLVTGPVFCLSVSWAATMELFIAYTSGLVAGYCVYEAVQDTHKQVKRGLYFAAALASGLISLLFYQNGFGCFLLPFLLETIAKKRVGRCAGIAIGIYLLIYGVDYMILRYQLASIHATASYRTTLATDPLDKLLFFLGRALPNATRGNLILNERGWIDKLLCFGIVLFYMIGGRRKLPWRPWLFYLAGVFGGLLLIYLPSLVVRENYASNRTMLALDLAIFVLLAEGVLQVLRGERARRRLVIVAGVGMVVLGWYNFRYQFLQPVQAEYEKVRAFVEAGYHPDIQSLSFIRPPEDLSRKTYGITSSWDEFGIPCNFFEWVPEDFVRQIIYEKSGSRAIAGHLTIRNWASRADWEKAGERPSANVLVVDVEKIVRGK